MSPGPHDGTTSGPGSNSGLSLELQRTLRNVSRRHQASLTALREALYDFVDNLRATGLSQQQTVDSVRRFVVDTHAQRVAIGKTPDIDDALVEQLTQWCIDHWDGKDSVRSR
jgi:hypothetical protein